MNEDAPKRRSTGAMMIAFGAVWLAFSVGFLLLTAAYLFGGAGLQLFGFMDVPGGVFIGWIHVMGFLLAAGLCFAIGCGLCAHGLHPKR